MKNTLIKALEEQKELQEMETKRIAGEIIRIKKEDESSNVDALKEAYIKSTEPIAWLKKAILHEQRTNELPKDFDEKLLIDDARLKEWLFDYAKGINEKHLRECGVL